MATNRAVASTRTGDRSRIEWAAFAVGAVFALVGILGFTPGITQDLGEIAWAGPDSEAMLLGLFQVSVLHNAVHLLFGIAGLAAGRGVAAARTFLIGGGGIYVALWVYGTLVDQNSDANFVPVNTADNWLHLGLSAGMILLGIALAPSAPRHPEGPTTRPTL